MNAGTFRIIWLWIGGSAVGLLAGEVLAVTLFSAPPVDPAAWEGPRNQYDLREAAYSLAMGIPFAISQWLVLSHVLAVYDVPRRRRSVLWIPVTSVGVAAMIFLMPSGMPTMFLRYVAEPMLPAIVLLSLAQWLVLRWLIKAGGLWFFLTAGGAVAGVYVATYADLIAGPAGWALMFGASIGFLQSIQLPHAFAIDHRRREAAKPVQSVRGESIAGIGLAVVVLIALAPSFLAERDFRSINSVAYSRDGTRIAADVENFVYLWEAETGKLLFAIDSGQGQRIWNPGHDLTFSADGSRIAVSSHQAGAIILNGETGQRLVSIKDDRTVRGVGDIAFSPDDGRVVLTLSDGFVGLYDASDGRFLGEFQSSIQQDINLPIVRSAAFNRKGTKAAAGGNYWPRIGPPEGFAAVWDIGTKSEDFTLTGHSTSVRHLAFSPDDTHVMTVGGERVRIWDARNGAALTTLRPDCCGVADAAYQSDGNRIAIACEDGTVHECATATGQCTVNFSRSLTGMDAIVSTGIHPDGERIVMATLSGSLAVWNMRTGERILKLRLPAPE